MKEEEKENLSEIEEKEKPPEIEKNENLPKREIARYDVSLSMDRKNLPIQYNAKKFNLSIDINKNFSFILTENLNVYVSTECTLSEEKHDLSRILDNELIMEESLFLNHSVYIPWFRAKQLGLFSEQEKSFTDKHLIPEMRKMYCAIRCFEENISLSASSRISCHCSIDSNRTNDRIIYGIGY